MRAPKRPESGLFILWVKKLKGPWFVKELHPALLKARPALALSEIHGLGGGDAGKQPVFPSRSPLASRVPPCSNTGRNLDSAPSSSIAYGQILNMTQEGRNQDKR